jgi:hypothetical protein
VDLERRGSEGGAPRKARGAGAPAKSRWMMGRWYSGELWGRQLREAALGSSGSSVDERRMGEKGHGAAVGSFGTCLGGAG